MNADKAAMRLSVRSKPFGGEKVKGKREKGNINPISQDRGL